jgi:hypothetical protein
MANVFMVKSTVLSLLLTELNTTTPPFPTWRNGNQAQILPFEKRHKEFN